jgi:hypothetical protein
MTQDNLFTSLIVPTYTNIHRGLRILYEIFKRPSGTFNLYIQDKTVIIKDSLEGVLKKFAKERKDSRIYYYIFK